MSTPVALLVTDIHLQLNPPVARGTEASWLAAMAKPLRWLRKLAAEMKVPVVCGGDVFDHWKASPELINFALDVMPDMYAIPGQHDLPLHQYEDMFKSAYWTLVKFGKIKNLEPGVPALLPTPVGVGDLWVTGFPWGFPVEPCKKPAGLNLAVVHAYIWVKGCGYHDAPVERKATSWRTKLKGYDVALFGDNHIPFISTDVGTCTILNHGAFIRRKSDERHLKPAVGVLYADGTVSTIPQPVGGDSWLPEKEATDKEHLKADVLIRELEALGVTGLDFEEALRAHMNDSTKLSPISRRIIAAILEQDHIT